MPTIRLKNATLLAEMLAHGVLDFFAETLTETIQTAVSTALDGWLKEVVKGGMRSVEEYLHAPVREVVRLVEGSLPVGGLPV